MRRIFFYFFLLTCSAYIVNAQQPQTASYSATAVLNQYISSFAASNPAWQRDIQLEQGNIAEVQRRVTPPRQVGVSPVAGVFSYRPVTWNELNKQDKLSILQSPTLLSWVTWYKTQNKVSEPKRIGTPIPKKNSVPATQPVYNNQVNTALPTPHPVHQNITNPSAIVAPQLPYTNSAIPQQVYNNRVNTALPAPHPVHQNITNPSAIIAPQLQYTNSAISQPAPQIRPVTNAPAIHTAPMGTFTQAPGTHMSPMVRPTGICASQPVNNHSGQYINTTPMSYMPQPQHMQPHMVVPTTVNPYTQYTNPQYPQQLNAAVRLPVPQTYIPQPMPQPAVYTPLPQTKIYYDAYTQAEQSAAAEIHRMREAILMEGNTQTPVSQQMVPGLPTYCPTPESKDVNHNNGKYEIQPTKGEVYSPDPLYYNLKPTK